MKIRPYQSEDLEPTVRLWWETRQIAFPYIQERYTFDEYVQYFKNAVAVHNQIWIAEIDDRIVGFIGVQNHNIDHLYVEPAFQKQGVGTALLNYVKEQFQHLSLYTFEKNRVARSLYEKQGFKAVRFGVSPDEGEPDVYYEWTRQVEGLE